MGGGGGGTGARHLSGGVQFNRSLKFLKVSLCIVCIRVRPAWKYYYFHGETITHVVLELKELLFVCLREAAVTSTKLNKKDSLR